MRLDDLRAKTPCIHGSMAVHFVDDDPDQRCEPRHTPVSRAEVLQAALTEPCPNPECWEGTITTVYHDASTGTPTNRDVEPCPDCEGRAWLPIDGGVALLAGGAYGLYEDDFLVVPLSMLTDGSEGR